MRLLFAGYWKVCLNISKLAKFESDCLSEQRYSAVKLRKFTDVFMGGGGKFAPPPHHTKVFKFRNFVSSLVFNKSLQFKLSNFTNFKALFPVVWRIFRNLSMSKVESNRGRGYWIERNCRTEISKENRFIFVYYISQVQTNATLLAKNSQHCSMLYVASICTPCCMLLRKVWNPSNL